MHLRPNSLLVCFALAACASLDTRGELRARTLADCDVLDATPGACGYPRRVRHRPTELTFVLIEPHPFRMGVPAHEMALTQPYYIATTEVTVEQWRRFAEATGYRSASELERRTDWRGRPDTPEPADHPVRYVSFVDARAFCAHFDLALPGEAQWEFACRAGAADDAWFSDPAFAADKGQTRSAGQDAPAAVASFEPNAFGLFDMLGNVAEWTMLGFAYTWDPKVKNWEVTATSRGGSYIVTRRPTQRVYYSARNPGFPDVGFRPVFTARLP